MKNGRDMKLPPATGHKSGHLRSTQAVFITKLNG